MLGQTKEAGENSFNGAFYVTKYIQNVSILTGNQ